MPDDVRVVHAERDHMTDCTVLVLESRAWPRNLPGHTLEALNEYDVTSKLWVMIQRWEFASRAGQDGPNRQMQQSVIGSFQHQADLASQAMDIRNDYDRQMAMRGNGRMHDENGIYNPEWDCQPIASSRNTVARGPSAEWEQSVASLWNKPVFEGIEEALAAPGEGAYIHHVAIPCGVKHSG
jgi:hypothetical protein